MFTKSLWDLWLKGLCGALMPLSLPMELQGGMNGQTQHWVEFKQPCEVPWTCLLAAQAHSILLRVKAVIVLDCYLSLMAHSYMHDFQYMIQLHGGNQDLLWSNNCSLCMKIIFWMCDILLLCGIRL